MNSLELNKIKNLILSTINGKLLLVDFYNQ